jgi:hypothetical protein
MAPKRLADEQQPHPQGGQHRVSVGVRSLDGETPAEWRERIRRSYVELGETPPHNLKRFERWTSKRTAASTGHVAADKRRTLVEQFECELQRQEFEAERAECSGQADVPF